MSTAEFKHHLAEHGYLWGPDQHPYGVSGLMSYGPAGAALKANIESEITGSLARHGFEPVETPVMLPDEAWVASGHDAAFRDEMFYTTTSSGRALTGRPEIATTIYPLFSRLHSYYGELPFRVQQHGPALPNDRQTEWQLRTRQYTAIEGHIFADPSATDSQHTIQYLGDLAFELMNAAGLDINTLDLKEKKGAEKPGIIL